MSTQFTQFKKNIFLFVCCEALNVTSTTMKIVTIVMMSSSIGREKQGSCRENLHMGNIVTQKKNTGKDSTHQSLSECRCVERG